MNQNPLAFAQNPFLIIKDLHEENLNANQNVLLHSEKQSNANQIKIIKNKIIQL